MLFEFSSQLLGDGIDAVNTSLIQVFDKAASKADLRRDAERERCDDTRGQHRSDEFALDPETKHRHGARILVQ
ncbi:MAG TPA: hypothetical protein VMI92_11805 [Steroidobacteraceae bacterium]|nr:hypothetical protein [Steroidobacteraceae bacterium]